MFRVKPADTGVPTARHASVSVTLAAWLLDHPHLAARPRIKRLAGHLLKHPARRGVVAAQSRLGQLLCRDCDNPRDQRVGQALLHLAAKAGDQDAQQAYARLTDDRR